MQSGATALWGARAPAAFPAFAFVPKVQMSTERNGKYSLTSWSSWEELSQTPGVHVIILWSAGEDRKEKSIKPRGILTFTSWAEEENPQRKVRSGHWGKRRIRRRKVSLQEYRIQQWKGKKPDSSVQNRWGNGWVYCISYFLYFATLTLGALLTLEGLPFPGQPGPGESNLHWSKYKPTDS